VSIRAIVRVMTCEHQGDRQGHDLCSQGCDRVVSGVSGSQGPATGPSPLPQLATRLMFNMAPLHTHPVPTIHTATSSAHQSNSAGIAVGLSFLQLLGF
jgi:hypothetical protein